MINEVILPNQLVAILFGWRWMGFVLALGLLLWAGVIIIRARGKHQRPFELALDIRIAATDEIAQQATERDAQDVFARNFDAIDVAMNSGEGAGAKQLQHAWTQFKETFVDDTSQTLFEATARPDGYFLHLGGEGRVLAWWANIFVALGLTATFLGIIAALAGAVATVGGGNMQQMQAGLMTLLTMTATKFWTSIGGVGASIILRYVAHKWQRQTDRKLETLCERLEYGTRFSPPQRFAVEQLRELKQQSVALTEFSHQLAASIGDALGQQMQPVVSGLSGIQASLNEFKEGSFNQIGQQLGDAISKGAGLEMQALAGALESMTTGIASVNDRLEGASGQASEQIAAAAREFSAASLAMTEAFATLNDNIDGMARRMGDQAREAEERQRDRVNEEREAFKAMTEAQRDALNQASDTMRSASVASTDEMVKAVQAAIGSAMGESTRAIGEALKGFEGATAGIQSAFDQMQGRVAELGEKLAGSTSEAADRNADVLRKAADTLEQVAGRTQMQVGAVLDEALRRSSDEAGRMIAAAFASFGAQFAQAGADLTATLNSTAGRMEALSSAFARSATSADGYAEKIAGAGREAHLAVTSLGEATQALSVSAAPIVKAATAIESAAVQTNETVRNLNENNARYQGLIESVTGQMKETAQAASISWEGYRNRFAEVDKSLAEALDRIRSASAEHATALNTEVGRIDKAMAAAVERLAPALDVLTELTSSLEDLAARLPAQAE